MNGAHGEIKAHVDTPAGTEEDVFVTEVDDDRYAGVGLQYKKR